MNTTNKVTTKQLLVARVKMVRAVEAPGVRWVAFRYLSEAMGNGECNYTYAPNRGVWHLGAQVVEPPTDLTTAASMAWCHLYA